MRVPTRKVWRAFPELDRFSDEQCARFVRAAEHTWAGVARAVVAVLVCVPCWAVGLVAFVFVVGRLGVALWLLERSWGPFVLFLALVLWIIAATLPAWWIRDAWLRRDIARVMGPAAACRDCGYSLLGLPVPLSLRVVCPECGHLCDVPSALRALCPAPETPPAQAASTLLPP